MVPPDRENALVVFGQRRDARVEIDAWNAHATRFFATRIGLTIEKRYEKDPPSEDEFAFIVAAGDETPGVRSVFVRPSRPNDYAAAAAIETRVGYTGLSLLARRCGTIWLIVREGPMDSTSLRLAAILASVLLGPILDETAGELFGVKTARAKLDALALR